MVAVEKGESAEINGVDNTRACAKERDLPLNLHVQTFQYHFLDRTVARKKGRKKPVLPVAWAMTFLGSNWILVMEEHREFPANHLWSQVTVNSSSPYLHLSWG